MKAIGRKLCVILLAIITVVAFTPVMDGPAYAGGGGGSQLPYLNNFIDDLNTDGTATEGKTISLLAGPNDLIGALYASGEASELEAAMDNGSDPYFRWEVWSGSDIETTKKVTASDYSFTVPSGSAGKTIILRLFCGTGPEDFQYASESVTIKAAHSGGDETFSAKLDMSMDSKGILTVTGKCTGTTFTRLVVQDRPNTKAKELDFFATDISGKTSFTKKIDTTKYDVGYHELKAEMKNGKEVYTSNVFPTKIYDKPTLKKNDNFLSTGSKYICYRPYFTVPPIYDGVYMQLYDTKTKKWGDVYGPYPSYEILRTRYFVGNPKTGGTKIQSNRTYKIRTFFAKQTKYAGKKYYLFGPMSRTLKIKTGKAKKPAVKSIKITKAKQKKIKLVGHAHWDAGGVWHPYTSSYTWTTTYKVTVKLKKKPGTVGIYIGSKKIKGNKKTYTATFTDSGKLKGKKIKVDVCSYNDSRIGAYSPVVSKRVKVR